MVRTADGFGRDEVAGRMAKWVRPGEAAGLTPSGGTARLALMIFASPDRPTLTYRNITVSEPAGFRPLHLDLHIPPGGSGPYPLVMWIHGGAWLSGSRTQLPESIEPFGLHQRLVDRGYAVADIDYRLSAEAQYPAQLIDVQAAVRWLRSHAVEAGLDAGRFAALGESAGAHLAIMAALVGDGDGDASIHAVVSWYGPADLSQPGDGDDPSTPHALLLGGAIGERLDFARSASPIHRVHPDAPPLLSVHGTEDQMVPFSQSELMTEALHAFGVRADLHPVEGADHCFVGYDDIGGLIDASIDFLDDVLNH